jgi:hypothetical protein
MFCPNCGADIPEDSGVCPECNTEIVIARTGRGRERDAFIVADDISSERTPGGWAGDLPVEEETGSRSVIIEAEEDELTEEEGAAFSGTPLCHDAFLRDLPEETGRSAVSAGYLVRDGVVPVSSDPKERGPGMEDDGEAGMDKGETDLPVHTGDAGEPATEHPLSGGASPAPPSDAPKERSGGAGPRSPAPLSAAPPSRRRPGSAGIVGIAVGLLVVLGIALLVYGLPGEDASNSSVVIPTPLPTVVPDTTPVPPTATETPLPWTPSENLQLSVSAYGGGYKVEIEGGLLANEVEIIEMTVEDAGGEHTMDWVYPSRHETFFMARDAYNGSASATEHVTATATYSDRSKEVVFSGDL